MNKKERIEALLQEKRISYNGDGDFKEGNRVGGLYELIQDFFEPEFVVVEIGSCEGTSTELIALREEFDKAISNEKRRPDNTI